MSQNPQTMRVPPQNIEAERALLGALMIRHNGMHEIVDTVSPESFYVDKHRIVYEAMLGLFMAHSPIDIITIQAKLTEKKLFNEIGGLPFLTELTASVPSTANLEHYASLVVEKSTLRNLIEAGNDINDLGYAQGMDLEVILDTAEKTVYNVTQATHRGRIFSTIREILPGTMEQIERLSEHTGDLRGVPSGFRDLDQKLSGLQPSDLLILAARPSVGKTSFALDIARRAALYHNIPVGIFSLEMSAQQLVDRMVASDSRVNLSKIRTGKNLTPEDFDAIRESMARLAEAPVFIDDEGTTNVLRMRSTARRLMGQHGLGLIIVDYLQLIQPTKNYDNMVNQISEVSRSLKQLAKELNVPVLALSQLSRAVEARGGKPRLSDLRDSGAIEQDADVVMFIHREKDEAAGAGRGMHTEILIEKHRNGPTGVVNLFFDAEKATFLDVDKSDFGDL
jgi:replicative DNA helicase